MPYIFKSILKETYQFTDKMIRALLPAPIERPNHHGRNAPPIKLWDEDEVKIVVESQEYKDALEEANRYRTAYKEKRLNNIKKKVAVRINNATINITDENDCLYTLEYLKKEAFENQRERARQGLVEELEHLENRDYNIYDNEMELEDQERIEDLEIEIEHFHFDHPKDPATMDRWTVNFIRHRRSNYEFEKHCIERYLDERMRVGLSLLDIHKIVYEGIRDLKIKILDKIAETYPELAAQCELQKERAVSECTNNIREAKKDYELTQWLRTL